MFLFRNLDDFFGVGLFFVLTPLLLLSFLVIYIVDDTAGRREGRRDPLLGAKVFLTLLATVGVQTDLAGMAILMGEFFENGDYGQALQESGGMILGGGIVAAYAAMAYYSRVRMYGTNRVLKQAIGLNAIVTGLIFAFALTSALHTWMQGRGDLSHAVAFTIIYFAANLFCVVPLLRAPETGFDDEDE